jgi:hypothetical protein
MPSERLRPMPDRLVYPIEDYESSASRIHGFQELLTCEVRVPDPMFILGHEAFKQYLDNDNKLTSRLTKEISRAYAAIRHANPARGAFVGRAFFVPGVDNPNGPRTAAIWDNDTFIREVPKFWDFVIEHGYNVEGADIALILHPFINVMDPRHYYGEIRLSENEWLPWSAGYAVQAGVPGRKQQVEIVATFGPDEAVQSCPADRMLVDPERGTVFRKEIAVKTQTYVPVSEETYVERPILPQFQLEQALTDEEAIAVAQEATKIFSCYPDSRVEFILQPDGIYVRELAPWKPTDEKDLLKLDPDRTVVGPVIRVEKEYDVAKVAGLEAIVYFGPEAFRRRTTDLFARVAHLKNIEQLIALVYGTATTSHMARILSDAGRSVILVGNQDFMEGEPLKISRNQDGSPSIEFINPYHGAIAHFSEVERLARGEAGNKVARLARMRHAGLPIPDGFGIVSQSLWQYLIELGLYEQITSLDTIHLDDLAELEKITNKIQQTILTSKLPKALGEQIRQAVDSCSFAEYAIRSSGSEDADRQSFAGLYQSTTQVKPEEVTSKLRETVSSYFSSASIVLVRQSRQLPSRMSIGVGVHEYIPTRPGSIGAVVFTFHDAIMIEAIHGSPKEIVSGTAQDYLRITVPRISGEAETETVGEPGFAIEEETLKSLVAVAERVEALFQSFQDIELLVTPKQEIVIVQARPL